MITNREFTEKNTNSKHDILPPVLKQRLMNFINTLGKKIGLGFASVVLILAISVGISAIMIQNITVLTERVTLTRMPTARLGLVILNGVNQSVSSLRGYVLFQEEKFKDGREAAWNDLINPALFKMNALSDTWTHPENVQRLNKVQYMLKELEQLQLKAEQLAGSDIETARQLMDKQTVSLVSEITPILEAMTDSQEKLMAADVMAINNKAMRLNLIEWCLLISGIVISTIVSLFITRTITRQVSNAVDVADNIAGGNLETDISIRGSLELERLGSSLVGMRNSLRAKTIETENYNWLTSGQNQLSEIMRLDQGLESLCNDIIRYLAEYTRSHIGAVFLLNETRKSLLLCGKYAYDGKQAALRKEFKIGEGIIGQVAADGKSILLSDVGEGHIHVNSSLISTVPKSIFIVPFSVEGKVLGVVELGRIEAFDEIHIEFLELTMEAIGMTINSAIARSKVQELLEETQRQSEELQTQQEELQQTNEELEEQAERLKQQQEELQSINQELEEQAELVEKKNIDLEAARLDIELKAKRLEVSSKYKSEFLANMSHELRTPLNSLLILSNDLLQNKDGNLSDEQLESADVIARSGYDLLNLINEILDLAKIEAGKMDLNIEKVSTLVLADNITQSFKTIAKQKGLEFRVIREERLPEYIKTDPLRLDQIIKNLLSNAFKFTESGSVTVTLGIDTSNKFLISVSDTGIGIEKKKQEIVFEAFQQADGSISRKYGGTGLGLSICRELTNLFGGSISLDSEPGKGSVFTVTIPVAIKRKPKQQNDHATVPQPITGQVFSTSKAEFIDYPCIPDQRDLIGQQDRVILIIEDDQSFAKILTNQASIKGFKYLVAASGEDGLILARKFVPHAIMLDLDLPGMDGRTVLQELKNDPDLRHIPVHIISVDERTMDPFKSGAVEFLTKPVTKEQLNNAFLRIQDFINRKMKNLLIIEDDKYLRKSIMRLIGNGDVQCFEAGSGKEALELLGQMQIDCMILDIGLPDMSGFDLMKKMDNLSDGATPPIIVYTGRDLTKEENDELHQYAETIIVKGVKSEERLLDETALFLHRTVRNLPKAQQQLITGLYDKEAVFRNKKVLLVDDDMRNVFALSKVLREKGMEIIKAENGVVALSKLETEEDIDIVLMDVMMPEMNGYDCIREIRSNVRFKDIPIIALTAKAMKEDRQTCINAGANDYISKPVDLERLMSLIRVWIRKEPK